MKFQINDAVKIECDENPEHYCVGLVGKIIKFPKPATSCGAIPHEVYTVRTELGTFYILGHDLRELP